MQLDILGEDSRSHPPAYEIASKLPTYEEAEGVREIDQDLVCGTLKKNTCLSLVIKYYPQNKGHSLHRICIELIVQ